MNRVRIILLLVFVPLIIFFIYTNEITALVVFVPILIAGLFVSAKSNNQALDDQLSVNDPRAGSLCYQGTELNFSDELLTDVLNRHFPFFTKVSAADQQKFISRLKHFISEKT